MTRRRAGGGAGPHGGRGAASPSEDEQLFSDARRFLANHALESLAKVEPRSVRECSEAILGAKQVFTYGVGRSGLVAQAFAVRLVQLGLKAHFIGDIATPVVTSGDVDIIISNVGQTMSAVQTANIMRRVGAKVVVVTANLTSKLAQAGNVTILLPVTPEQQQRSLAPLGTVFEDCAMILLDALVPVLMKRLGESEESMRARHAIWV
jgi:6-phospho-3-hexuloisomerase